MNPAGRIISRRGLLRQAGASAALGLAGFPAADAVAALRGPRIAGSGRISGKPVEGRTIPSPSDFGCAADDEGGLFVCSMFGPDTGGFKGCTLMTVALPDEVLLHLRRHQQPECERQPAA